MALLRVAWVRPGDQRGFYPLESEDRHSLPELACPLGALSIAEAHRLNFGKKSYTGRSSHL